MAPEKDCTGSEKIQKVGGIRESAKMPEVKRKKGTCLSVDWPKERTRAGKRGRDGQVRESAVRPAPE